MASAGNEDSIFDQLRSAPSDFEHQQNTAINERINKTFRQSQQRLAELIDANSTLPTTVSSVTVLGAPHVRHGFLKRIVEPLLSANQDRPYTQSELVREVSVITRKLAKFGMTRHLH